MTPIPAFPASRALEPTDRPLIEAITRKYPPYSDYNFTSLYTWDTAEDLAISCLNGNLAVRFTDYTSGEQFWSFIGTNAVVETARTLLRQARAERLAPELRLIPEMVVTAVPGLSLSFSVRPDEDNYDYLYDVAAWVELDGPHFRQVRKSLRRCQSQSALAFRPIDLNDPDSRAAVIDVCYRWHSQKPEADQDDFRQELVAIERLFLLLPDDRIAACGITDGDRLVAFSIWEGLPGGDAVAHFAKAVGAHCGLSTYLHYEQCGLLHRLGYRRLDLEQDLGIPGLRQHKRSLRPCGYLRKYQIAEWPGLSPDER